MHASLLGARRKRMCYGGVDLHMYGLWAVGCGLWATDAGSGCGCGYPGKCGEKKMGY